MQLKLKKTDGNVDYLIFSEGAEKWAEYIHKQGGRNKNKSSQLRKFYDEFVKLNQRSAAYSDNDWQKVILPQLHMLIPKVVYAGGRKLVTTEFEDFIKQLVNQVKSKQDLKIATNFFEAFVGFYRRYGDK